MIRAVAVLFVMVWLFGITTSHTLGGGIHFLILAVVALLTMEIIRNQKTPVWLALLPRRLNSSKSLQNDSKIREWGGTKCS